MQILRRMFLFPIIAGLLCLACNNPLQTQQTLDSWQNRLLANDLGFIHNPACSPDGRTIAFMREQSLTDVYSLDLFGRNRKTFCKIKAHLMEWPQMPQISPDGTQAVYLTTGNAVIVEDLGSGETTTIFQDNFQAIRAPKWSADGQYVYYSLDNYYIEKAAKDGSDKTRVTPGQKLRHIHSFHLSPDGQHYVISGSEYLPNNGYNIYLLSVADDRLNQLTNMPGNSLSAAWAPDGQSMALFQYGAGYDLLWMDLSGAVLDTLARGFSTFTGPFWTKNGDRIIFWAWDYINYDQAIYEYTFQNKEAKILFPISAKRSVVSLNPADENTVLFRDSNVFYNISTITLDSVVTDITPLSYNSSLYPGWTPSGEHILYADSVGLNRIPKHGGEGERINISSSYSSRRTAVSPNGKYLAVDYSYNRIDIYDYSTLELVFRLVNRTNPSWSPNSDKLVCTNGYSVYVYQMQNDKLVLLHDRSLASVRSVDWSKTPSASGFDILCCVGDAANSEYEILLLDDKLEKAHQFADMYEEKLYGCWMPNGLDIIYSHDAYLRIRRVASQF